MKSMQKVDPEVAQKQNEEIKKYKEKLDAAETHKVMLETKLGKLEKELKECQELNADLNEKVKAIYEKKEAVVAEKEAPKKIEKEELKQFEQKCDDLTKVADTIGTAIQNDKDFVAIKKYEEDIQKLKKEHDAERELLQKELEDMRK